MGGLRSTSWRRRLLGLTCATALAWSGPAHAGQLKAAKAPRVSGPLSLAGSACSKDTATHEGQVIARLDSCVWIYEFDNTMETDPLRTYGVGWVQTSVDPVNGWCATKVESELTLPDEVEALKRTPKSKVAVKKKSRTSVKLKVDAGGYASLEEGRVSQRFNLFPAGMRPSGSLDGGIVRTTWTGRESARLAFALGAEISWELLGTPSIRGGLGHMSFVKSSRC